jgi:hypothetical protein
LAAVASQLDLSVPVPVSDVLARLQRELESRYAQRRAGFELWFWPDDWHQAQLRGQAFADWLRELLDSQLEPPPPWFG